MYIESKYLHINLVTVRRRYESDYYQLYHLCQITSVWERGAMSQGLLLTCHMLHILQKTANGRLNCGTYMKMLSQGELKCESLGVHVNLKSES